MVGFAVAITVEVSTGKGLLEVQSASFHYISFTRNEWLILTYIFFWHLITPFFSIPNTTFSAYYTMSFFHHLNNIEFGNQVVTVLIGCHNGFFIFPCHTSYDRVGPLIPLCTLTWWLVDFMCHRLELEIPSPLDTNPDQQTSTYSYHVTGDAIAILCTPFVPNKLKRCLLTQKLRKRREIESHEELSLFWMRGEIHVFHVGK